LTSWIGPAFPGFGDVLQREALAPRDIERARPNRGGIGGIWTPDMHR
jgi:hypothetical protein